MQIPKTPKNDGSSCRRRYDVPIRKTGVNESMGMDNERSDEDRALKIRYRPTMFRNVLTATAE
jgi:hypothetical protein